MRGRIIGLVSVSLLLALLFLQAQADALDSIVPDDALWGMSRQAIMDNDPSDFQEGKVGKSKSLRISGVTVGQYKMDVYYVFGEAMWDADGWTYSGLSKVAYILTGKEKRDAEELDECRDALTDMLWGEIGEPDKETKSVATWNRPDCKIEVGKGKFKNYNGSDNSTVAIIFTAADISKPMTPEPSKKPTPTPRPKSTPKPIQKTTEQPSDNNGFRKIDSSFVDSTGYTSSQWLSTEGNRCVLTVSLTLLAYYDSEQKIDINSMVANPSYIGRMGITLYIIGKLENGGFMIRYSPYEHNADYNIYYCAPSESNEAYEGFVEMVEGNCDGGFYMIDNQILIDTFEEFAYRLRYGKR